MASQTVENYLKALYLLVNKEGEVSLSGLSSHLGVSTPTANNMVKKLHSSGWVKYEKYKPVTLTPKGKKAAALILRKHRLTEMFLVEKMGFGWEQVHDIAEQIEHIQSPEFFDRMDVILGHPTIDPHGSPIPDVNGNIEWKSYAKLSECKKGDSVKLVALTHSNDDFLKFLNTRKLRLGILLTIKGIEQFDGSMTVSYGDNEDIMLSKQVCENLLVEQ